MSKEEKSSALGTVHPVSCWGHWNDKYSECRECMVSKKCADTTKRIASGETQLKPAKAESTAEGEDAIPAEDVVPVQDENAPVSGEEMEKFLTARMKFEPTCFQNDIVSVLTFTSVDGTIVLRASIKRDNSKMKLSRGGENDKGVVLSLPCSAKEVNDALDGIL